MVCSSMGAVSRAAVGAAAPTAHVVRIAVAAAAGNGSWRRALRQPHRHGLTAAPLGQRMGPSWCCFRVGAGPPQGWPSCQAARRGFASSATGDPYKVLGVPRSATPDDIKSAYRKQALKWHPDKHLEDERPAAQRRFTAVADAYELLRDPEKRRLHDSGGASPNYRTQNGFQGGFPGGFHAGRHPGMHTQETAERMYSEMFGDLNAVLGQLFGQEVRPGGSAIKVGTEVRVQGNKAAVLRACRESGIDTTNDTQRRRALGNVGVVLKVDPSDQSVKVKVKGVGDVWFGLRAVKPTQSAAMAGFSGFEQAFNMHGGGFGGGMGSPGATQIRQEMVQRPDGKRVIRVTTVRRMPDGTAREDVMETQH